MTIPEDRISEIRDRVDIVALVGEYVPLKRVGASFRGLCPFHAEKSPSFYVHPARQFYHCFGCQESGDVITFLMRAEGHSFPEAARILADRAGVELPTTDSRQDAEIRRAKERTELLYSLMDAATGFFLEQLEKHPHANIARAELEKRGVSAESAAKFRLGYAPSGWDGLANFLKGKNFSPRDAEAVGLLLARKTGDGHYDRFRHRLMFPVSDAHGRVIAFSGRLLDPPPGEAAREEPGAKYVNSPESPLYKKGEVLFGLHEARLRIRREGWAILCEGNFDVVALHQAGFDMAVAPLGTAFTESQARLLRRYTDRVTLVFDSDSAGRKATRAAYPLLQKAGVTGRVVRLPEKEDPDSFLRTRGNEAFSRLADNAQGLIEFLIDEAISGAGSSATDRAKAIEELGPILASVENPVETQLYIERIAQKTGLTDLGVIKSQLRRGLRAAGPNRGASQQPSASQNARSDFFSPGQNDRATSPRPVTKGTELPGLECEIVGAFLDSPKLWSDARVSEVENLLTSDPLRSIFLSARRLVEEKGLVDASGLLSNTENNPARRWLQDRLSIEKFDEHVADGVLRDSLPKLRAARIMKELPELKKQIIEAQQSGDEIQANSLRQRHKHMLADLRALQGSKG